MKWKNTDKNCEFFNESNYKWYLTKNKQGNCFWRSIFNFYENGYLYPKTNLTSIDNFKTTTIKQESKLYFDQGSSFPRFKLSLSNNKRCIKVPKADYIVVSGSTDYKYDELNYYVVEDDDRVYVFSEKDWSWFGSIDALISNPVYTFINPKLIYSGKLYSFEKDSLYLLKYVTGEYTVPFITDKDLDKIICDMCSDITYDELLSIIDMLDSEDASVVQLGMKALQAYNVEKYKLTLRLILMTRINWYTFTRNTVGTNQLMETLGISRYYFGEGFENYAQYADDGVTAYTAEDIALAKQIGLKLLRESFQKRYDMYYQDKGYKWLPDERKIEFV